jgi:hypothetical protein
MFSLALRHRILGWTLLLSACGAVPLAGNAVTIKAINDDPRSYVGKTVLIEGQVINTMSLVLARYFVVDDGTGSMTVITDKPLPGKGQRMRVKGRVSDFFSLGPGNLLVLIEEKGEPIEPGMQKALSGGDP